LKIRSSSLLKTPKNKIRINSLLNEKHESEYSRRITVCYKSLLLLYLSDVLRSFGGIMFDPIQDSHENLLFGHNVQFVVRY